MNGRAIARASEQGPNGTAIFCAANIRANAKALEQKRGERRRERGKKDITLSFGVMARSIIVVFPCPLPPYFLCAVPFLTAGQSRVASAHTSVWHMFDPLNRLSVGPKRD